MTRDPRIDPQPGDVIIYGPQWQSERIEVFDVSQTLIQATAANGNKVAFTRDQWTKWMRNAEVLHVAER